MSERRQKPHSGLYRAERSIRLVVSPRRRYRLLCTLIVAAASLIVLIQAMANSPVFSRVGLRENSGVLVATGETLHPTGQSVTFGGRPVDIALSPDGSTVFLKDNRGLVVIDKEGWSIRQELPVPAGGTSLHGLAVRADGKRVYLTSAANQIYAADITPQGTFAWNPQAAIILPGPSASDHNAYPCGLSLSPDGTRAYVCLSRNNTLGIVDLTTGQLTAQVPVGVAPWSVVLSPDSKRAYVSDWGGRRANAGDRIAASAGTSTLVDARGIASSGAVSVVDLMSERVTAEVAVGLHPCDMALTHEGRALYVANANDDTVSVLDLEGGPTRVRETLTVRPDASLPFGSMPDALALSRDEKTLYVALGGSNAVAVMATQTNRQAKSKTKSGSRIRGFIPTGWYPGALAVDDAHLYVANVKGLGSRGSISEPLETRASAPAAPSTTEKQKRPAAKQTVKPAGWNVYDYTGSANRVVPRMRPAYALTPHRCAPTVSSRNADRNSGQHARASPPFPFRLVWASLQCSNMSFTSSRRTAPTINFSAI